MVNLILKNTCFLSVVTILTRLLAPPIPGSLWRRQVLAQRTRHQDKCASEQCVDGNQEAGEAPRDRHSAAPEVVARQHRNVAAAITDSRLAASAPEGGINLTSPKQLTLTPKTLVFSDGNGKRLGEKLLTGKFGTIYTVTEIAWNTRCDFYPFFPQRAFRFRRHFGVEHEYFAARLDWLSEQHHNLTQWWPKGTQTHRRTSEAHATTIGTYSAVPRIGSPRVRLANV